jgi:hypothetical protein
VLPIRDEVVRQLEGLKWFVRHGNVFRALKVLGVVVCDLEGAVYANGDATARKLYKVVQEFSTYLNRNQGYIPNYGERISIGFVESTVDQVVSKRLEKKQQMRWSQRGAHLLLQIRTRVLNDKWEDTFGE